MRAHIGSLGSNNAQNEYYLTDLVAMAVAEQRGCAAVVADDAQEIMGVNDRLQLADAAKILRRRINDRLMQGGVTLIDPERTYIDAGVVIAADTEIWPGCVLRGRRSLARAACWKATCRSVIAPSATMPTSKVAACLPKRCCSVR